MALKKAFDVNGSNSKLVVLACVSPSVVDAEDTHGTLKYVTPFQVSLSLPCYDTSLMVNGPDVCLDAR